MFSFYCLLSIFISSSYSSIILYGILACVSPSGKPYLSALPFVASILCLSPPYLFFFFDPSPPEVFLFFTSHFSPFFLSLTSSALRVNPFIFPWLLIPAANGILHLNTNKAICMSINQYQNPATGTPLFTVTPRCQCECALEWNYVYLTGYGHNDDNLIQRDFGNQGKCRNCMPHVVQFSRQASMDNHV